MILRQLIYPPRNRRTATSHGSVLSTLIRSKNKTPTVFSLLTFLLKSQQEKYYNYDWLFRLYTSTVPGGHCHCGVSSNLYGNLSKSRYKLNFDRINEKISLAFPSDTSTHHVTVGREGSLSFTPDRLNANIGDRIIFNFHSVNHPLTQSSLEAPCSSIHQFDTGFIEFNSDDRNDLSVGLTVNTLEPQWYYCRQRRAISHCHAGMIFALNPGNQMDQFRKNAKRQVGRSMPSVDPPSIGPQPMPSPTELAVIPVSSNRHPLQTPTPSSTTVPTTSSVNSGQTVVVFTRTVTKYCSCHDSVTEASPTSSYFRPGPTLLSSPEVNSFSSKRNVSSASMASDRITSGIIPRLGRLALGYLVFFIM
jgi:plastocyanin